MMKLRLTFYNIKIHLVKNKDVVDTARPRQKNRTEEPNQNQTEILETEIRSRPSNIRTASIFLYPK